MEPRDDLLDRPTPDFLGLPDPLRELRPNTPLFRLSRLRRDNQSYAASPYLVAALGQASMIVMHLRQVAVAPFGYPLKAGHLNDCKDLALLGIFVSVAEVEPRYGLTPFQRDPETSAGKTATLASCHLQRDHRSYVGRPTPCGAAWAVHADCDAFVTESRCALPPLTRHAEKPCPGRSPTPAKPPGLVERVAG